MRDLMTLDRFRRRDQHVLDSYGSFGNEGNGAFIVPSPIDQKPLRVVASNGAGWDHVSVSRETRCPNWHEMEHIARLFFRDDETAMQLHVPASEHVNHHPFTLHWWIPQDETIPRPPAIMVGPK